MSNSSSTTAKIINDASSPHFEQLSVLATDFSFRSADGVLFHLPKKYLEATMGPLAPPEFSSQDEIVDLPETAKTLELLFKFIYPARHPGLASTPFGTLAPLAEAAEKYQIYAAMNVCQIRMMEVLPKFAEEVMAYAVKHDYLDIMCAAAPLLLEKPVEDVLAEFPPVIAIAWARYHGRWSSCARSAMLRLPEFFKNRSFSDKHRMTSFEKCNRCGQPIDTTVSKILIKLAAGIPSLKGPSWMGEPGLICCEHLNPAIVELKNFIQNSINNIPEFSTFV